MKVNRVGVFSLVFAVVCAGVGIMASGCAKEKRAAGPVTSIQAAGERKAEKAPVAVENPDAVVVSVYGKKLTKGEINREITRTMASPQFQGVAPEMIEEARPRLENDIADRFVTQCVLEHAAEARNIVVNDKDREEELALFKDSIPAGMPFEQVLAMMGMDMAEVNNRITTDLKIRKMLDAEATNVPPASAEEVFAFYTNSPAAFQMPDHVKVRHVLIAFDNPPEPQPMPGEEAAAKPAAEGAAKPAEEAAKAEKRKKAESVREELVKGADFATVAKANSDCPSKSSGGDLGRVAKGQYVPEFEAAAFSQEVNAIGPVVETKYGYHVIQVLERNAAGLLPFEKVKSEISEYLLGGKRKQVVTDFVEKLKADAKIEYAK
ncbi:MAG: peptidylprolyl isomerase [bacterium]